MRPRNEDNFLIEVTREQLDELTKAYQYVDEEGYEEMHYSPYWRKKPRSALKAADKEGADT